MRQILLEIPLHSWFGIGWDIPIHGYGFMLFLAFIACTWLASVLARRQGIPPELIQDLAIYLFVFGIIGARLTFVFQYFDKFQDNLLQIFAIWDGGLVFYGSVIGGLVGFILAHRVLFQKHKVSFFNLADVISPCLALGLALGRIGCLLNGCCYGGVAGADCPAIHFPLPAEPRHVLVANGYQTAAGFTLVTDDPDGPAQVSRVEPGSPAADAGLQSGDLITEAEGKKIGMVGKLHQLLVKDWQRGDNDLLLKVLRTNPEGGQEAITLPPFEPRTIGIHPTQIYETITTSLLLFFLLAYLPFRRHNGELLVLTALIYSVHRFINEMIRIDTEKTWIGDMTISQNISVVLFVVAIGLGVWLWRQPPDYGPGAATPEKETPEISPKKKPTPETALQD
jgi:phosphatidylglycerol:prolipoprotein diacylglycerol transferase